MSDLTAKQELFVQEYLIDLNATQAAIRAGYSEDSARSIGCENLTKPDIQEAIAAAQAARVERIELTQDYVLNTVIETVERCKQAKPVLDRKGDPVLTETPTGDLVPAYVFDTRAVLKGAEMLGKHIGMFRDKLELTGKDGGPIQTEEISDTEAARRVAFLLARGAKEETKA